MSTTAGPFHVVDLEPLVRMKLTSYRLKDRVHLLDMINVGLIDASWPSPLSRRACRPAADVVG